ncbi:MAG: hydrogenase maturation protease [Saprospiraceae bacterium]|nr:hydrogenase maturation protease [Bacteroidia bacterium]MBT8229271.1 hydrogenase maturation protease [Bacteroidia bacterium]NNF21932.1 hydrogenase maturation protease [Saprospiraceae bacterium]
MQDINNESTIVIGIGNCGRSDDGLGWALAEHIEESGRFKGDVQLRYQLQVEDAELISHYDQVVFIDAFAAQVENGYRTEKVVASDDFSFSTHEVAPEAIMYLCQNLYKVKPRASILLIGGKSWDMKIGLSPYAKANLRKAIAYFNEVMTEKVYLVNK